MSFTYSEYGVQVALATDDEGVARSEISREYLKAAEEHGLYLTANEKARLQWTLEEELKRFESQR